MDQQQLAMMRQNYAAMNSDELVWIAATRQSTLTQEAKLALDEIIQLRKLEDFECEVAAVKEDLARQQAAAMAQAAKQDRLDRMRLRFLRWSLIAMVGIGGMLIHDFEFGLTMASIALLVLLWVEIKRLPWQ